MKMNKSQLLLGSFVFVIFASLISHHVEIERGDHLVRYFHKINLFYFIPLIIILFIFLFIKRRSYKFFMFNIIFIGWVLTILFLSYRDHQLIITDQYLKCSGQEVFFADTNSVTFERVGRFGTLSLNFATDQGDFWMSLADICTNRIDIIVEEFLGREIPVYK